VALSGAAPAAVPARRHCGLRRTAIVTADKRHLTAAVAAIIAAATIAAVAVAAVASAATVGSIR